MVATPLQCAGQRSEPPMSLPCAIVPMPAATAAPAPPDDPPQVMSASQGFSVSPCSGLSVKPRNENSGVLVRPMHDRAGLLEIAHDRRVGRRDDVHLRGHAVGVGPALVVDVFLDRDRHAVQQAELAAFCPRLVRGFCRLERLLGEIDDDRVEFWIDRAHARDMSLVTSSEEIAPERIAAAVSTADHCQTGPLGVRTFAAFLRAFAPAPMRLGVFIVDFLFGAVFLKPLFLPIIVFLATSFLRYPVSER